MDGESFQKLVQQGLQKEIDAVIVEETEKAAEQAKENVRKRIKEMTVKMSANILQRFSMGMRDPNELYIRINFSEDER